MALVFLLLENQGPLRPLVFPKGKLAEPTLWVWLCYQRAFGFPCSSSRKTSRANPLGMALLVFPAPEAGKRNTKQQGNGIQTQNQRLAE
jgi:hypothetical protein